MSYLYGEIKRGVDGNYYIPNMGRAADQIHAYNGSGYTTYSYATDTLYKLASGLPTQVYKLFDNNTMIKEFIRTVGNKDYELKDHLGNVRVVVSDAKLIEDADNSNTVSSADNFVPEVLRYADYMPFGMLTPGRQFNSNSMTYGFNGKMNDNEVKGTGNQQDYGMRIYDPRIAKFLSVDPLTKEYSDLTPYQFASNMPIVAIDRDGLEGAIKQPNGTWTTPRDGRLAREVPREAMDQFTPKGEAPKLGVVDQLAVDILTPIGEDINTLIGAGEKKSAGDKVLAAGNLILLGTGGEGKAGGMKGAKNPKLSSRAARRQVMREQGIPTSQQPKSQSKNASGREYSYEVPKEGGGTETKSVQEQTMDRSHQDQPHWEAGKVKERDGQTQYNPYGRPKLENDPPKSKTDYEPKK